MNGDYSQGPMTPYGREIPYDDKKNSKKPKVVIVATIVAVIVVIVVAVVSIILLNKSPEEDTYIKMSDGLTEEFYDLYTSEAMQDIDEAMDEYFSDIYRDGVYFYLQDKKQNENGDYIWTIATDDDEKHTMLIEDNGSSVSIEIDDTFKKTYINEPHPDD